MDANGPHDDTAFPTPAPVAPPAWHTLGVPWRYAFQPRTAATLMVAASRRGFWISFGLCLLAIPCVLVWLFLWADMVTVDWSASPAATTSAPWTPSVVERSAAEVWRDWHTYGWLGWAEWTAIGVVLGALATVAFMAWLHLGTVHESGPAGPSYRRAFRAVASVSGLVVLATLVFGSIIVALDNAEDRLRGTDRTVSFDEIGPLLAVGIIATICLLPAWIGRAVRDVRQGLTPPPLPPRCEGCGYDLTHVAADGRCTECGLDVASSLTPDLRRPGCPWEDEPDPLAWLRTSYAVIVSPATFYGRLRLRTPERPALHFSLWHYAVLGIVGAVFMFFFMMAVDGAGDSELVCLLVCAFLFAAPAVGWITHRFIGAVATSWWLTHAMLPDVRWARKVIAYETAYLWIFGLYNMALFILGALTDGRFAPESVRTLCRNVFGMRPEEVLFCGNSLLCFFWLWRYRTAIRAIRWSNF
ncbi:MAG: hypothetical protein JXA69_06605 [Phycisphaerae bacterium]|nr:hypothetical protein [Phycisphaerae bacterium]